MVMAYFLQVTSYRLSQMLRIPENIDFEHGSQPNTVRNNFRCGVGKARSGKIPIPHRKYRYHMWYRKKPMWYRYFRCGIGIFPLRAFPIPERKLFLTVYNFRFDAHTIRKTVRIQNSSN